MPAIDPWHLIGAILPHVRDPWPRSIGLGFPFTVSGAAAMLAEVICAELPHSQRVQVVNRFAVLGFRFGAGLYLLALLVQVTFAL
jgi:hypothetical protein